MDIQSQINSYGPKNDELLATLAKTDYAPPALQSQNAYIKDLSSELAQSERQLKSLESKTKLEQADFQKMRDSTMKRFAYRMGGSKGKEKFASKTDKEEKEYYDALHAERQCRDRRDNVQKALNDANAVREQYENDSKANTGAQNELDNIYNMIFSGPTPAYPEEDQKEWPYTQARNDFGSAEQKFQAVSHALSILEEASMRIKKAQRHMADARDASRMDMLGGGMMADMAERDACSKAESEASQVQSLINQAQRFHPEIRDIGNINIAKGSMMSDVLFDNIFSDMNFHEKIKSSQMELEVAGKNLLQQIETTRAQNKQLKTELDQLAQKLGNARRELQQARQAIFEQAKGGQQAPPAYAPTQPAV